MSEHVRAGGSRIHRIIACPGSLQAPETEAGAAAALGTAAHYIGERCLMTGCNADHPSFTGDKVTVQGQKITRAVADAVQVYVDWVRSITRKLDGDGVKYHLLLESQVDWAKLAPPEPMRGSADVIIVVPAQGLMVVGDYKNGTDYVEHVGNKQLRYYAVGALVSLPRDLVQDVKRVQLAIIQPNVPGIEDERMVRSEEVPVGELLDFADEALLAVQLGQAPDAPRIPGKHCKYCGAAATCEARAKHAVDEAQGEFDVVTVAGSASMIATMPVAKLGAMALQARELKARIEAWLKDAEARIETELKTVEVPGWKMVAKRANRVWNDELEVELWAQQHGLKADDVYAPRALKSPAQLEEIVGKKALPKSLYTSVSSGYNLVPATSSKDAARISAGDEFETVKS